MSSLYDVPDPTIIFNCSEHIKSNGFKLIHKLVLLYKEHPEVKNKILEIINLNPSAVNSLNDNGWTPLHLACANIGKKTTIEIVKLLIDNGADVNSKEVRGWTPLHLATENGNIEVVKMLIEEGADVNPSGYMEFNPLHQASLNGDINIIKLLIKKGCYTMSYTQTG